MNKNVVETLMGAFVLVVAAGFLFTAYKAGNVVSTGGTYKVKAKFREVGTLGVGSDIRIGGIRIGSITAQWLDPVTYMAIVELQIDDDIKLPKDSTAAIVSDGLLGGKYVTIEPGADNVMLTQGDIMKYTQDAINIEALIGKFAFGGIGNDVKKDDDKKSGSSESSSGSAVMPSLN